MRQLRMYSDFGIHFHSPFVRNVINDRVGHPSNLDGELVRCVPGHSGDFVQIGRKKLLGGDSALHDARRSSRMDETNVRKAHIGKDETQVRNLVIERGHGRTFGVPASTRNDHEHFFPCAGQQAFGFAVSFVPESTARTT